MDLFTKYMNLVGYNEEQYIIQPNDAMNKIMSGAKQVQMELFKEADSDEIKLMVRTDGKVKIVKGDIAKNSILAIEKISGRENIIRDFLQDDTEIKMMNPTRDHASHNGFDITITALADGQYKITFTKPDAKIEKEEKKAIPAKRYISRNDVSGKESFVENEFFHADDTLKFIESNNDAEAQRIFKKALVNLEKEISPIFDQIREEDLDYILKTYGDFFPWILFGLYIERSFPGRVIRSKIDKFKKEPRHISNIIFK